MILQKRTNKNAGKVVTSAQAAKSAGVHHSTIRRWKLSGEIESATVGGSSHVVVPEHWPAKKRAGRKTITPSR